MEFQKKSRALNPDPVFTTNVNPFLKLCFNKTYKLIKPPQSIKHVLHSEYSCLNTRQKIHGIGQNAMKLFNKNKCYTELTSLKVVCYNSPIGNVVLQKY